MSSNSDAVQKIVLNRTSNVLIIKNIISDLRTKTTFSHSYKNICAISTRMKQRSPH